MRQKFPFFHLPGTWAMKSWESGVAEEGMKDRSLKLWQ